MNKTNLLFLLLYFFFVLLVFPICLLFLLQHFLKSISLPSVNDDRAPVGRGEVRTPHGIEIVLQFFVADIASQHALAMHDAFDYIGEIPEIHFEKWQSVVHPMHSRPSSIVRPGCSRRNPSVSGYRRRQSSLRHAQAGHTRHCSGRDRQ